MHYFIYTNFKFIKKTIYKLIMQAIFNLYNIGILRMITSDLVFKKSNKIEINYQQKYIYIPSSEFGLINDYLQFFKYQKQLIFIFQRSIEKILNFCNNRICFTLNFINLENNKSINNIKFSDFLYKFIISF